MKKKTKIIFIVIILVLTLFLISKIPQQKQIPGLSIILYDKDGNEIQSGKTFAVVGGTPYIDRIRLKVTTENTGPELLTCKILSLTTSGGNGDTTIFNNAMTDRTTRIIKSTNPNSFGAWTSNEINVNSITSSTPYLFTANINCTENIGLGPRDIGIKTNSLSVTITADPFCSNNIKELGEICDGTALGGNDCTTLNQGFISGTLKCNPNCLGWDTNLCVAPTCGNNDAETGELCDGTDLNGRNCMNIGQGFTEGTLSCAANCHNWNTNLCVTKTVVFRTNILGCTEADWRNANPNWIAFDREGNTDNDLIGFGSIGTTSLTSSNTNDYPAITTSPCGYTIDSYTTTPATSPRVEVSNVGGTTYDKTFKTVDYTAGGGIDDYLSNLPCCGYTCGTCCERYSDGTSNC